MPTCVPDLNTLFAVYVVPGTGDTDPELPAKTKTILFAPLPFVQLIFACVLVSELNTILLACVVGALI